MAQPIRRRGEKREEKAAEKADKREDKEARREDVTKTEAFDWLAEQAKVSKIKIVTEGGKHKLDGVATDVYTYVVQASDPQGRGIGGRGKTMLEAILKAKG